MVSVSAVGLSVGEMAAVWVNGIVGDIVVVGVIFPGLGANCTAIHPRQ
jgi:hypothetical protein